MPLVEGGVNLWKSKEVSYLQTDSNGTGSIGAGCEKVRRWPIWFFCKAARGFTIMNSKWRAIADRPLPPRFVPWRMN